MSLTVHRDYLHFLARQKMAEDPMLQLDQAMSLVLAEVRAGEEQYLPPDAMQALPVFEGVLMSERQIRAHLRVALEFQHPRGRMDAFEIDRRRRMLLKDVRDRLKGVEYSNLCAYLNYEGSFVFVVVGGKNILVYEPHE